MNLIIEKKNSVILTFFCSSSKTIRSNRWDLSLWNDTYYEYLLQKIILSKTIQQFNRFCRLAKELGKDFGVISAGKLNSRSQNWRICFLQNIIRIRYLFDDLSTLRARLDIPTKESNLDNMSFSFCPLFTTLIQSNKRQTLHLAI